MVSTEVRRCLSYARGAGRMRSVPPRSPSPIAPRTSFSQPPNVPLVLSGPAPLGAVDEQRSRVGRQLVQLDFERVCVVLDETSQSVSILLGGDSPAHMFPPEVLARLGLVHAPTITADRAMNTRIQPPAHNPCRDINIMYSRGLASFSVASGCPCPGRSARNVAEKAREPGLARSGAADQDECGRRGAAARSSRLLAGDRQTSCLRRSLPKKDAPGRVAPGRCCWSWWWAGAGSNRRPSAFQADARTD